MMGNPTKDLNTERRSNKVTRNPTKRIIKNGINLAYVHRLAQLKFVFFSFVAVNNETRTGFRLNFSASKT